MVVRARRQPPASKASISRQSKRSHRLTTRVVLSKCCDVGCLVEAEGSPDHHVTRTSRKSCSPLAPVHAPQKVALNGCSGRRDSALSRPTLADVGHTLANFGRTCRTQRFCVHRGGRRAESDARCSIEGRSGALKSCRDMMVVEVRENRLALMVARLDWGRKTSENAAGMHVVVLAALPFFKGVPCAVLIGPYRFRGRPVPRLHARRSDPQLSLEWTSTKLRDLKTCVSTALPWVRSTGSSPESGRARIASGRSSRLTAPDAGVRERRCRLS